MSIYNELRSKIDSLAVFRQVKEDPAVVSLRKLLDENTIAAYSDFISTLYPEGANLSEYIRRQVLDDDNFYVKAVAAGKKIDPEIAAAVKNELNLLVQALSGKAHHLTCKRDVLGYSLGLDQSEVLEDHSDLSP